MLKLLPTGPVAGDVATDIESAMVDLDELCWMVVQQMLAAALLAERRVYLDAHADVVDATGHRVVVGNGFARERDEHGQGRTVRVHRIAGPLHRVVKIINLGDDPILVDFGRITFRNDADAAVDTENFLNLLLYQSVNYLEVRLLEVPDTPAAFDVNFGEAVFVPSVATFTIADFGCTVNSGGRMEISGSVSSTFAANQEFVSLILVFTANGEPVFAASERVDFVPGEGVALLSERLFLDDLAPEWDDVLVFAGP